MGHWRPGWARTAEAEQDAFQVHQRCLRGEDPPAQW
jgi:hypothetical protein